MSDHALQNAQGWLSTVRELVARLDTGNGEDDQEAAREEIEQSPLSVMVRSGWYAPVGNDGPRAEPAEYEILLTTGGPALRIVGDLDGYAQPDSAVLQWQDWGTPWTPVETTEDDDKALMTFASVFYYGEG